MLRGRRYLVVGLAIWSAATAVRAAGPVDGYADYVAYVAAVQQLDASEFVQVESLGQTLGGREIYLLKIGTGDVDAKPAFLLVGNVYAPHLAGSELALRVAQQLSAGAAADPTVREFLDRVTVYVIPRPSPDASEGYFQAPFYERAGNLRPTDDDRDFRTDEDGPDDLNGDGWITQIRVADPTGQWMPHPAEPRVLIQADRNKNEQGQYLLLTEGRDDDHDEQWNEDGPGGVDFNRNFTFNYPHFQPGSGPNAVSEVETRAVADFAFGRTNIAGVFVFSPEDNLFHPWQPGDESQQVKQSVLSADAPLTQFLAERYRALHGGQEPPPPAAGAGSLVGWSYFHYGRWTCAARGWWIPPVPLPEGATPPSETRGAAELNRLRWFAQQNVAGFVDWTPIEHPDFPGQTVEVGGFKPLLDLSPPVTELDGLAGKHLQFLRDWAGLLPQLAWHDVQASSLGGGLYRIEARLVNAGYLPTLSAMGELNREPYPLQIHLQLPEGASLVSGLPRQRVGRLAGRGGEQHVEWIVRGAAGLALRLLAESPALHPAEQSLSLP